MVKTQGPGGPVANCTKPGEIYVMEFLNDKGDPYTMSIRQIILCN